MENKLDKTEVDLSMARLFIQGYYNRISFSRPDNETILRWLEDDLQSVRMEELSLCAINVLNARKELDKVMMPAYKDVASLAIGCIKWNDQGNFDGFDREKFEKLAEENFNISIK